MDERTSVKIVTAGVASRWILSKSNWLSTSSVVLCTTALFNVCIPVSCGPLVIFRIVRRVRNDFTFHCSIFLANFQLSDEYDSSGTIHLWHEHISWICLQHITFHNKNTLGLAQIAQAVKTSRFIANGTQ